MRIKTIKEVQKILTEALSHLPLDVIEGLGNKRYKLVCGRYNSPMLGWVVQKRKRIYLNLETLREYCKDEIMYTLAHEYAHAYLGHKGRRRKNGKIYGTMKALEDEAEAGELAEEWRFKNYFLIRALPNFSKQDKGIINKCRGKFRLYELNKKES